jgi:P-type conjugative transfer protein TrbG
VYGGVERVTDIALQPGEKLSGEPIGGDTVRWAVSRMKTGTGAGETWHVVIKPMDEGIETNILIPTDRRVYRLQVRSSLEWFMPGVSWTYPADEAAGRPVLTAASQREERQREPMAFAPDRLDFSYVIKGDEVEWKPVRAFNDGSKTFLQMPAAMKSGDAPALFVVEEGGEPMLVNYRVKDGVYIVDRLFKHAELRVGATQKVTVRHEAPSRGFWSSQP